MLEWMWEFIRLRPQHWVLTPLPGVNEDEAKDLMCTPWDDVDRALIEYETIGGE